MRRWLTLGESAGYSIQFQGYLGEHWSDYLGGLSMSVVGTDRSFVTTLSGQVRDQAALMGVLNQLYDMGFPLLSVECLSITRGEVDDG